LITTNCGKSKMKKRMKSLIRKTPINLKEKENGKMKNIFIKSMKGGKKWKQKQY